MYNNEATNVTTVINVIAAGKLGNFEVLSSAI
jgi:hypothetical protein